jgi:hypothetical protein
MQRHGKRLHQCSLFEWNILGQLVAHVGGMRDASLKRTVGMAERFG